MVRVVQWLSCRWYHFAKAEDPMSTPQLPDFDHALRLAHGNLRAHDLAECHGALCGLLCRMPGSDATAYHRLLGALHLAPDAGPGVDAVFDDLHRATLGQLHGEELAVVLWLPDDEVPLEARTRALSHWCSGFLAGLAGAGGGPLETLSDEAAEALNDLQEIARADVAEGADEEEEESAFAEIVEYVRVATLMLFEDLRGPRGNDRLH